MRIRRRESLAARSSFRIGGPSRLFAEPETTAELAKLVARLDRARIPYFLLGGGTNTLFSDRGFDGVVISTLALSGLRVLDGPQLDGHVVAALCGTSLGRVVAASLRCGLAGLERFVGIPGTIGGAVYGNAGGAHRAIGEVVDSVTVIEPDGTVHTLRGNQIPWRYRGSGLDRRVVAEVFLRLDPGERTTLAATAREIARRKSATQPLAAHSAGCVFRNPPGDHAARLIQAAGLAGCRLGGAQVSTRHVNFIVNDGCATAADVRALIELVRGRVHEAFGVELREEIAQVLPSGRLPA